MTLCRFPTGRKRGERCEVCGYTLKRDFRGPLHRGCRVAARADSGRAIKAAPAAKRGQRGEDCVHFIGWTDRSALSTCGCKGVEKNGTPTTIAECERHGDVTPLSSKTKEGLPSCLGCGDFRRLD